MLGRFFIVFLALITLAGCASKSIDNDTLILRIGSTYLTRSEMESRILEIGSEYVPYLRTSQGKKTLINAVVKEKLLVRVALANGLDRTDAFKEEVSRVRKEQERALRLYKESVLRQMLLERLKKKELKITDEEALQYFKTHRNFYSVRHMLFADEKSAQALHDQIRKVRGNIVSEFGRLAKTHSMEASSAKNGGKMPLFLEGELEENFERALKALKPNQVSPPVQSEFGYHLILLEGISLASWNEETKDRVTKILEKKRLDPLLAFWKDKYPLEVHDDSIRAYLGF